MATKTMERVRVGGAEEAAGSATRDEVTGRAPLQLHRDCIDCELLLSLAPTQQAGAPVAIATALRFHLDPDNEAWWTDREAEYLADVTSESPFYCAECGLPLDSGAGRSDDGLCSTCHDLEADDLDRQAEEDHFGDAYEAYEREAAEAQAFNWPAHDPDSDEGCECRNCFADEDEAREMHRKDVA